MCVLADSTANLLHSTASDWKQRQQPPPPLSSLYSKYNFTTRIRIIIHSQSLLFLSLCYLPIWLQVSSCHTLCILFIHSHVSCTKYPVNYQRVLLNAQLYILCQCTMWPSNRAKLPWLLLTPFQSNQFGFIYLSSSLWERGIYSNHDNCHYLYVRCTVYTNTHLLTHTHIRSLTGI